jgi:hypothetical protein
VALTGFLVRAGKTHLSITRDHPAARNGRHDLVHFAVVIKEPVAQKLVTHWHKTAPRQLKLTNWPGFDRNLTNDDVIATTITYIDWRSV